MSYDYDALYAREPDALGAQTPSLAAFLAKVAPDRARILDVGCGQGRDAIALARAGHDVTGVDLSPKGVAAMCAQAQAEGINITGHVADITTYVPEGVFDIVLIDRTLHLLDDAPRAATFGALIGHVTTGGWLVVVDETSNLAAFRATLDGDARDWHVETCAKGQLFAQLKG